MKPTTILGGSIGTLLQPLQNGTVRFFLKDDDGGTHISGGTCGQGHQEAGGGGSGNVNGNSGQQSQQQQQQQTAFVDPFANVDMELLDEATRTTMQNARTEMQRLHAEAQTGRGFQSQADRYKAELERLRTGGQPPNQQQQQQRQSNQPPTMEQEIYDTLVNEMGVPAAEAAKIAPFQARMLGVLGNRTKQFVTSAVGPVADNVAMQQAESNFESLVSHHDPAISTWFANPDVAAAVWDKVKENTAAGHDMPQGAIVNLAKIFYVDHHQANGNGQPLTLPNMQQQKQGQQQQQGTALRYPGAGVHTARPAFRPRGVANMDPDTAAAIAATKSTWDSWKPAGQAKPENVTRSR